MASIALTRPINFNPRTREGCDISVCLQLLSDIYFNPRTREGCDARIDNLKPRKGIISIHAPAKGATYKGPKLIAIKSISIHAPAKGATPINR